MRKLKTARPALVAAYLATYLATTWHPLAAEDIARHIPCGAWDCAADATWCETKRFLPNGAITTSIGFYYFCAAHADAPITPADLLCFAPDDAPACEPPAAPDVLDALYAAEEFDVR